MLTFAMYKVSPWESRGLIYLEGFFIKLDRGPGNGTSVFMGIPVFPWQASGTADASALLV